MPRWNNLEEASMHSTTACRSNSRGTRCLPGLCPRPGLPQSGWGRSRAASGNAWRLPRLTAGAAVATDALAEGRRTCLLSRVPLLSGGLRAGLPGSRCAAYTPLAGTLSPSRKQPIWPGRRPEKKFPSFCPKRDILGLTAEKQQRPIFFREQGAAAKHKRFQCSLPPQTAYLQGKQAEPCRCSTPTAGNLRCCDECGNCWRAGVVDGRPAGADPLACAWARCAEVLHWGLAMTGKPNEGLAGLDGELAAALSEIDSAIGAAIVEWRPSPLFWKSRNSGVEQAVMGPRPALDSAVRAARRG